MIYYQPRYYDRYNVKMITPPSKEQITLDEARDHLRIIPFGSPPTSDEDQWIENNIAAAREWCEGWSMVAFAPQTLELGIAAFPNTFYDGIPSTLRPGWFPEDLWRNRGVPLPFGTPLIAVDSVTYVDSGGGEVVLDPNAYLVNDYERPAAVYPVSGVAWPTAQPANNLAVKIRYRCGYSVTDNSVSPQTVSTLPFSLRAAMLLVLGHLHENRENTTEVAVTEIPLGAAALMERYRVSLGIA